MKKHAITALNACIVLASLLLLWQLLVWAPSIPKYMLPTPVGRCSRRGRRYASLLTSIWITGEAALAVCWRASGRGCSSRWYSLSFDGCAACFIRIPSCCRRCRSSQSPR